MTNVTQELGTQIIHYGLFKYIAEIIFVLVSFAVIKSLVVAADRSGKTMCITLLIMAFILAMLTGYMLLHAVFMLGAIIFSPDCYIMYQL